MGSPSHQRRAGARALFPAATVVVPLLLASAPAIAATPAAQAGQWEASALPLPAGAAPNPSASFVGVTCPGATTCIAIGEYDRANGPTSGVIETGAGEAWTAHAVPLPPGAPPGAPVELSTVTCADATHCAVLATYTNSANRSASFILTGSGSNWTAAMSPLPSGVASAGLGIQLNAITCASASSCVAVGYYFHTNPSVPDNHGIIITGYGASWRAVTAPQLSTMATPPDTNLQTATCPSSHHCLIFGQYSEAGHQYTWPAIVVSGFGASWSVRTLPTLSGPGVSSSYTDMNFSAALCKSGSSCLAVGDDQDASGYTEAFIYSLSAGTWSVREGPVPAGASFTKSGQAVFLTNLACPGTTCVAMGNYTGAEPDIGYISVGSGLSWDPIAIPPPASSYPHTGVNLSDLACQSSSFCVAVGMYATKARAGGTAIATGSGTSWHVSVAPSLPAEGNPSPDVNIFEVACAPATCVAVGDYWRGTGAKRADEPIVDTLTSG
ncbi:MAG TPA: hypothetical protein VL984_01350 [Acidimicrobiales bacterium]|nr:hypothetical protein [Acidimicrobiales bacterium]